MSKDFYNSAAFAHIAREALVAVAVLWARDIEDFMALRSIALR
jgi:hypothetical protein